MSHNPDFKSLTFAVIPGSNQEFTGFIPAIAPDGGRVVIDTLTVVIKGTIDVSVATWDGRDVGRLIGTAAVEKKDGRLRWMLSGYKTRIAAIRYNGVENWLEHANIAVANGAAVDMRVSIPMRMRYTEHPNKYALPADSFSKVTVTWASLASAGAGATLANAALTAYVLASWHSEKNVQVKTDCLVKSVDFTSNTQARTSLQGVVQDLDIVKEDATSGGAVVSAITDARIEDLGTPTLTFADLRQSYTQKRRYCPTGFAATPNNERFLEPVRESKCLPVIASDEHTKASDGKLVDALKLDVGTGTAGLSMITREVVAKSQSDYQETLRLYDLKPEDFQILNANGTTMPVGASPTKRHKATAVWIAPLKRRAAA